MPWAGYILRMKDKDALSRKVLLYGGPIAIGYYLLRAFVPIPLLPEFNSTQMYILKPVTDALANVLMSVVLLALFHKLLHHKEAPGLVKHLSGHISWYYCVSDVLLTSMTTLLLMIRGELMPGTVVPLLYGLAVLVFCYFFINWAEKHKIPNSIASLQGP